MSKPICFEERGRRSRATALKRCLAVGLRCRGSRPRGRRAAAPQIASQSGEFLMRGSLESASSHSSMKPRAIKKSATRCAARHLGALVAKELLPWTKRFPDEFYDQMFRLRGLAVSQDTHQEADRSGSIRRHQRTRLRAVASRRLAELGTVKSRKAKAGRRKAHHQFLTATSGIQHWRSRSCSHNADARFIRLAASQRISSTNVGHVIAATADSDPFTAGQDVSQRSENERGRQLRRPTWLVVPHHAATDCNPIVSFGVGWTLSRQPARCCCLRAAIRFIRR